MSLIDIEPLVTPAAAAAARAFRVLQELERAGIVYCVLRGGDQCGLSDGQEEIDLVISPDQLSDLCGVLAHQGFVQLSVWGHAPHHFFVSYDEATDSWLKLDVVTRVAYGRPNHAFATQLAEECLRNRHISGSVYVPCPAVEWVALLLHCVLDKGDFPEHWRRRLVTLCGRIRDEAVASQLLQKYWSPEMTAEGLRQELQAGRWDSLLAARGAVERRLAKGNFVRTGWCKIRDPLLRKLNRVARFVRPHAVSVAVLAPDGAGKSTLANGIVSHFFFPVEHIYMGLYQQRRGDSTSRRLAGIGLGGKLLTQWRRYWKAHRHKARGRFVIFDRYTYDALLPSKNKLTRWQRMRRWLLAHACPAPDLIVVLDAPGELLFARKGEHSPEYLEQHRQAYLGLRSRFPQVAVIDATRDAERVRCDVITHMWHTFAARLRGVRSISP